MIPPLSQALLQFILDHEHDDLHKLLLQYKEILGVPAAWVISQIAGRRKAKDKLPSYYQNNRVVYPPSVNLEQSSSEETAQLKANILKQLVTKTNTLIDLTGGFGVDAFYFSKIFDAVYYVEKDSDLLKVAQHNHQLLQQPNIYYHRNEAESFLRANTVYADAVYIDPSRRNNQQRVFRFRDCAPDVTSLLNDLFTISGTIMVKASPMLDLQQGLSELRNVDLVYIVAVANEVKEILFILREDAEKEIRLHAINLTEAIPSTFAFSLKEEREAQVQIAAPLRYLYEPNAAILKAGAFKLLAKRFGLFKLHASTHLYTSNELVAEFPGRVFTDLKFIKGDAKTVHQHLPDKKANVIVRNYPAKADELKKKLNIKDGGEMYLLAFTAMKEKLMCLAKRLK